MKPISTMRDSNGNDIPLKYVSKYDKAKDKAVRRILIRFKNTRSMLESVVSQTIAELQALAQTKESLGAKGNFSARSFDGLIQVSIRQQYNILLDERVVLVKTNRCFTRNLPGISFDDLATYAGKNLVTALRVMEAKRFDKPVAFNPKPPQNWARYYIGQGSEAPQ